MRFWWLLSLAGFAGAAQAVTDCSRARGPAEMMLCTSPRAAAADQRLSLAYRGAFARSTDRDTLRADQQRWQREVRDLCADVDCLVKACDERAADLDDLR